METYTVTNRATGESWEIESGGHAGAATIALRQHLNIRADARRATGTIDHSGIFQGYAPAPANDGSIEAVGPQLHVSANA